MKVRLRPGDRGVLEARLRAATTEQRQLLRLLIKQIEVGEDRIQIVYKVQLPPVAPSPGSGDLQHWLKFRITASR